MDVLHLADEVIAGRRLGKADDLAFFKDCNLKDLITGADRLRKHFVGDMVDLCTIIAGKSGKCGENCRFCAQSAHNHTGCEVHGLFDYENLHRKILKRLSPYMKGFIRN